MLSLGFMKSLFKRNVRLHSSITVFILSEGLAFPLKHQWHFDRKGKQHFSPSAGEKLRSFKKTLNLLLYLNDQ